MPFPNSRLVTDPFTFYSCFKLNNRAPEVDVMGRTKRKGRASHSANRVHPACVLSGAVILQHRTCLSTELGSVLPRVGIPSQRKISFRNSDGSGRVLVAII